MRTKQSKVSSPQILIRQGGRNVSRREAFEKAQVGFAPAYKRHWVEKVSIPGKTKYFDYDKVFGKKVV